MENKMKWSFVVFSHQTKAKRYFPLSRSLWDEKSSFFEKQCDKWGRFECCVGVKIFFECSQVCVIVLSKFWVFLRASKIQITTWRHSQTHPQHFSVAGYAKLHVNISLQLRHSLSRSLQTKIPEKVARFQITNCISLRMHTVSWEQASQYGHYLSLLRLFCCFEREWKFKRKKDGRRLEEVWENASDINRKGKESKKGSKRLKEIWMF